MEFRAGGKSQGTGEMLRQELLDDRQRFSCHEAENLGAGLVDCEAQAYGE